MIEEYYRQFPRVLRDALMNGTVSFPEDLRKNYECREVFRMVKYTSEKRQIDQSDFWSQVENKVPGLTSENYSDIRYYSCSLFGDYKEAELALHLPRRNKRLARGTIIDSYGPCLFEVDTSHVHLFLYDGINPSDRFEVILDERKLACK